MGFINECGVITIFPMSVECGDYTNPTTPISNNGEVSINITGGTPPYDITWTNNGSKTATLINLPPGNYTATVTDYWKDFTGVTTCVLSAQSYNYLLNQCCPPTLYWKLPNLTPTNLTGATVTGDCTGLNVVISGMTNDLRDCYCDYEIPTCITDKYSAETQTCGRKTIKYNAGSGVYYWFVQNLDYNFSVYKIEPSVTSGSYNIYNYSGCCSQSYMTGFTNNSVFSSDCGPFTGTGLFDWYNRTVLNVGLNNNYLFYPYYNSGTTKCMVSGGSNQEIVTISSNYNVLGKYIKIVKTPNDISYNVTSLVDLEPTVTWTPGIIYSGCPWDYFYNRS